VLFVEGDFNSLDVPIYAILFPGVSVLPRETCREVESAVEGIRSAEQLHWLRVWGIVDNDGRSREDADRLRAKSVFALPVFSVESLYYHPEMQRRAASKLARVTNADPEAAVGAASNAAVTLIDRHAERMCQRAVEKSLRERVLKNLPTQPQIAAGQAININIDVAGAVAVERGSFDEKVRNRDLSGLICRYPIRETGALAAIARHIGFQGTDQYEAAVLRVLIDEPDALIFVRALFDDLPATVDAA
jgi:hypothetical protein